MFAMAGKTAGPNWLIFLGNSLEPQGVTKALKNSKFFLKSNFYLLFDFLTLRVTPGTSASII